MSLKLQHSDFHISQFYGRVNDVTRIPASAGSSLLWCSITFRTSLGYWGIDILAFRFDGLRKLTGNGRHPVVLLFYSSPIDIDVYQLRFRRTAVGFKSYSWLPSLPTISLLDTLYGLLQLYNRESDCVRSTN